MRQLQYIPAAKLQILATDHAPEPPRLLTSKHDRLTLRGIELGRIRKRPALAPQLLHTRPGLKMLHQIRRNNIKPISRHPCPNAVSVRNVPIFHHNHVAQPLRSVDITQAGFHPLATITNGLIPAPRRNLHKAHMGSQHLPKIKRPRDTKQEDMEMGRNLPLVHPTFARHEFQLPQAGRTWKTTLNPFADQFKVALVFLAIQRELVKLIRVR